MIAIDTNALLRLVLEHPTHQAEAVHDLLTREKVFLPLTVILEAEWALRKVYEFKKSEVVSALREVVALPQVTTEQEHRVEAAFTWAEGGLDFPDALHLASSEHCEVLATFDKRFARRAERMNAGAVRLLT